MTQTGLKADLYCEAVILLEKTKVLAVGPDQTISIVRDAISLLTDEKPAKLISRELLSTLIELQQTRIQKLCKVPLQAQSQLELCPFAFRSDVAIYTEFSLRMIMQYSLYHRIMV